MSTPDMIRAVDLARYYRVKPHGFFKKPVTLKALDGVSFTIGRKETLAVVGESGCGKSTLARLITMIERPTTGQLFFKDTDVSRVDKKTYQKLRTFVQIVFQDPYGSLNPRKKIGSILEEPLKINTGLTAAQRREKALAMMNKVGLSQEHYGRYPHMFSGGQRQRIAVARALMLKPTLVVTDEPVSALDVSVQAQVLNLLMDLKDELDLSYLFISHDLSVVKHIADHLLVMYLGRPVEQGPKEIIFSQPLHPYTRALLAATPNVEKKERTLHMVISGEIPSPLAPPSGCTFHKRCRFMTDLCVKERPDLRLFLNRKVACHHAEVTAQENFL